MAERSNDQRGNDQRGNGTDAATGTRALAVTPEKMISRIKGALTMWIKDIEVEKGERSAALSFTHPIHGATVMVVAEAGPGPRDDADAGPGAGADVGTASVGVFVILGDYASYVGDEEAVFRLFSLNATLMSCAVGLLRLNEDEVVTALCRRLPADAVAVAEVRELIDSMIWEYAHTAGFVDGSAAAAEVDADSAIEADGANEVVEA